MDYIPWVTYLERLLHRLEYLKEREVARPTWANMLEEGIQSVQRGLTFFPARRETLAFKEIPPCSPVK